MSKRTNIINLLAYSLLAVIASGFFVWTAHKNILSRYVSFSGIGVFLGLLIGLLLFALGKLLIQWRNRRSEILHSGPAYFLIFIKNSFRDIWIHLWTAIIEESFWRFVLQTYVFGSSIPGLIVVALIFTYIHKNQLEITSQWTDFFIFSFSLGTIYYLSHDILAVISVHFTRNILILYDAYCGEKEEILERPI